MKRFSQRNSAFARACWDHTSAAYGKRRPEMAEIIRRDRAGYTREDFALQAGAWAVSRIIGKTVPPKGENTHTESTESTTASRYEPVDPTAFTESLKRAALLYGASLVGVPGQEVNEGLLVCSLAMLACQAVQHQVNNGLYIGLRFGGQCSCVHL